jgi:hypothetical protein
MSKRDRERKKVAKDRKNRTNERIKKENELGNGRDKSYPDNAFKKEGRVEFEVSTGIASKV